MIRLTRNKIDFKVYEDNTLYFYCLGNVFPLRNIMASKFISTCPTDLQELLRVIADSTSADNVFNDYQFSRKYKKLSNFVAGMIDSLGLEHISNDYYIPNRACFTAIGEIVYQKYYNKWSKIWDTFQLNYDSIRPYDMTISDKDSEKQGGTTKTDTENKSQGTDNNTSKVIDDTTDTSIYGFNSTSAVPSDKSVNKNTSTEENISENKTNREDIVTHGRTLDTERNITRKGNIGNITQQELIRQERELQEYIIWETIFNDLDRVFTRSKYI